MRRITISCFLLLFVLYTSISIAQEAKDVWDVANKAKERVSQQSHKKINTFKTWKQHLQDWGKDSNYNHALFIGGRLYSNGWGGGFIYQQPKKTSYRRYSRSLAGRSYYYRFSFAEVKHDKQIKQQQNNTVYPELGNARPFVYGKINNLYLLQLGYGREQLIFPGIIEGNIAVSLQYGAGFSLALLKPYYIKLLQVDYTPDPVAATADKSYFTTNTDSFLNRNYIFGGSKWSKGLNEINYVPGIYGELAFIIEPAKAKTFVQRVAIGGQLSAYSKSLSIMAAQPSHPYQAAFFVGLYLGKSWK
ncbi:hypothetical protein [Parapedobacter sp. 10938]|uniref:hypothetical protein n=1 Tax=Parapedobacter flavus TaxID=3110225 RepID=UPI002DBEA6E5|nr:hypothetical protein [Parapedobacter sp. 10938]MEC3880225.1 hypothetical protein [Parapedobacter sp. 10938]